MIVVCLEGKDGGRGGESPSTICQSIDQSPLENINALNIII